MDDLIEQIEQKDDGVRAARRRHELDAARRDAVVAACEAVAGWGPGSVVGLGGSVEEEDVPLQLAWAVVEVARAVERCGLVGRLERLAARKGDPARAYALGLVAAAGRQGTREELERRVAAAWSCPEVWREVGPWFRSIPRLLWPHIPRAVFGAKPATDAAACHEPAGLPTDMLDIAEVARIVGCSYHEARKRMLDGRIRAIKDGRHCRSRRDWIEEYMAATTVRPPQKEAASVAPPSRKRRAATVKAGGTALDFLRERQK